MEPQGGTCCHQGLGVPCRLCCQVRTNHLLCTQAPAQDTSPLLAVSGRCSWCHSLPRMPGQVPCMEELGSNWEELIYALPAPARHHWQRHCPSPYPTPTPDRIFCALGPLLGPGIRLGFFWDILFLFLQGPHPSVLCGHIVLGWNLETPRTENVTDGSSRECPPWGRVRPGSRACEGAVGEDSQVRPSGVVTVLLIAPPHSLFGSLILCKSHPSTAYVRL